jgi:hypothetical protein
MYKFLTWVKINFHWIVLTIITVCLIGVAINSCVEQKNEKTYGLTYTLYSVDTTQVTIITKGFPQLDIRNGEYRVYDNDGELFTSKDSVVFNNIELR